MEQLFLFVGCFITGVAVAILYLAESLLVKKTDIFAVTVILDILLGGIAVVGVVAVSFFNDGIIRPYFLVGEAMGIAFVLLLSNKIKLGLKKKKQKQKITKGKRGKGSVTSLGDFINS